MPTSTTLRNVLIATDGSASSASALVSGGHLARACEAALSVLYVRRPESEFKESVPAGMQVHDWWDDFTRTADPARDDFDDYVADRILADARKVVEAEYPDIPQVEYRIVRSTRVPDCIIAEATAREADLVVVGRHGASVGRGRRGRLGSVTRNLVDNSACDVLVADLSRERRLAQIVATSDGSENGARAVRSAARLAMCTGASLLLLHVLAPPQPATYPLFDDERDLYDLLDADARRRLEPSVEVLEGTGVEFEVQIEFGEPGNVICDTVRRADAQLVAVGRRGLSGVKRLFAGSVSSTVVREAPSSVLVVTPEM